MVGLVFCRQLAGLIILNLFKRTVADISAAKVIAVPVRGALKCPI
jgi:hypothetical protein